MRDGVPVSDAAGHGFGCRSIQAIAQQRGGLCQFLAERGTFLLRVVLPAEDRAYTSDRIEALMGRRPELRFQFIQENAASVEAEALDA